MKYSSPNLNCSKLRVVELVAQQQLKDEDREHQYELRSVSELAIEDLVTHHDNLVQDDQEHQVHSGPVSLLLGDAEQEFLLQVLLVELEQVLGPLYHVVDIVVCSIKDNNPVVKVEVVVKAKKVHGAVIDQA